MARTVKSTLLAVALLVALATMPLSSHAQESITIEGQVTNGTAEADVPQDLRITVEVFRQGESLETMETVADAEGRFSFDVVSGGEEYGYIINTEYAGGTYFFEGDYPLPPEPVSLVVYESTGSSETLEVRTHTLVINAMDAETRLMNAVELVGLENTGDRTFVPDITQAGAMNLLRFSLPATARDLDVQSTLWSGQIIQVEMGFALTSPVPPGTHEIAYTYLLPYVGSKLTYARSFPFGADTFRVLLLQDLGYVRGTGMQELENLVLGERDYLRLEAHNLISGDSITLDFTGLTGLSLWQRWQDIVSGEEFLRRAIPGGFGMALVALLAYVLSRKRTPSQATAGVPGEHSTLAEALARLDDRFQQGEVGSQEYLQRRRELKGQIPGSGSRISWPETRPAPASPTSALPNIEGDAFPADTAGEESRGAEL